jgi:protein-lysine N-methyltransferase EEF2KMT
MTFGDTQSLEIFKRQYFQYVPVQELRWPSLRDLRSIEAQRWLFENLFDSNGSSKFFPPERYQIRVLKKLVERVEETLDDPDEDVR